MYGQVFQITFRTLEKGDVRGNLDCSFGVGPGRHNFTGVHQMKFIMVGGGSIYKSSCGY